MPNLTPIPLSVEEHERLTSLKHKLEANSWREMLMKLCDIHEEHCQKKFDLPLAKEGIATENPEFKNYVNKLVDERIEEKEGESDLESEELRRIVREEVRKVLSNHTFEVEIPQTKKSTEPCEGCGTKVEHGTKYCSGCGEELDWEEDE